MRKWLLAIAAVVLPVVAHAACDPTQATAGMLGCSPTAPSAAGTDYLYLWQPPKFPNSQQKITVDSLFNGRGAPNLASPGPIGGTTPNTGAFTTITGDTSGATSTATGSTTARTDAARFAERINVRDYGAVCDNVTDDRNAFAAAINRVNTLTAAGQQAVIHVPAGSCRIFGTNGVLPSFALHVPGGIVGDGTMKSWIVMDATYSGDLFSWSEAWSWGTTWTDPNTVSPVTNATGPMVENLTIVGNLSSATPQIALNFYDRNDYILVQNVSMFYVNGSCISAGTPKNVPGNGSIRESNFNFIKCFSSGTLTKPAMDFNAFGARGATPANFSDIDIYGSNGVGFQIRNNAALPLSGYKITRLRVEGLAGDPAIAADLVVIGDATATGQVHDIWIDQLQIISPYTNFCGMRLTASAPSLKPFGIFVTSGQITRGGGTGKGLCIDAGSGSSFKLASITTTDTNVTIGSAATGMVGTGITIDGNGAESSWTWSVDASSVRLPQSFLYKTGVATSSAMSVAATFHDGSTLGGNAIGAGAVDMQMVRSNAGQVASASISTAFGSSSTVAAQGGAVGGGSLNVISGAFSAIPGGTRASDRGRTGMLAYANGLIATGGDAELTESVYFGSASGSTAFRLTNGGAAATTNNCFNIPNGWAFGFGIRLHARNFTTSGQDYDWYVPNAMLTRDANVASTVLTLGTPVVLTRGTVTGAAVAATADITNGCLSLTFAPPTANTTDVWHASARIDSIEVQ
jgi:hypothetical protein